MKSKGFTDAGAALMNAGGLSLAAGGVTAAVSRIYTQSWPQACMLGMFGTFITLFFMAPQLIARFGLKKTPIVAEENVAKQEVVKATDIVKRLKPAKRLVPFRQQS
jgi:UDP-N-acetylmuramyl pentapeptide phosphotransferase/UDP-N-acetylglucosamine-1-phosphate transferase